MSRIEPTERTELRRQAGRAVYDREVIYAILDEALSCHVGFVDDDQPYVIPTNHVRMGGRMYIHGSPAGRMLRRLRDGCAACVTVTLLDGLVLARSAVHHSMNYRSVVVLGVAEEVRDRDRKLEVLEALVEHVVPGRSNDVRRASEAELDATALMSFPLTEASAKVRTGPPDDEKADYARSVWAGVIPLALTAAAPLPDPRLPEGVEAPEYVHAYRRPAAAPSGE